MSTLFMVSLYCRFKARSCELRSTIVLYKMFPFRNGSTPGTAQSLGTSALGIFGSSGGAVVDAEAPVSVGIAEAGEAGACSLGGLKRLGRWAEAEGSLEKGFEASLAVDCCTAASFGASVDAGAGGVKREDDGWAPNRLPALCFSA